MTKENLELLDNSIGHYLQSYKRLPNGFVRNSIRKILIIEMNKYNTLVNKIAYSCSNWW